ncbi:MAG: penicillin-binding protein 2 [Paludibacteraceae bacterium]|nr:penicillin-binding protein 2 [Paludibacteraceae bacterium]
MSDNNLHTIARFALIFIIILACFCAIIGKIIIIQYHERDIWLRIANNQVRTNVVIPASRGNILDSEGNILASNMPQYIVTMDTRTQALHLGGDTLYKKYADSIANGLSRIIGDKSGKEYRALMDASFRHKNKEGYSGKVTRLSKKQLTYIEMKQVKALPLVNRGVYKSGIQFEDLQLRIKPFGNLASKTIGAVNKKNGHGRAGLESFYDSYLTGKDGLGTRQRVGGRMEIVTTKEAEDGLDVITNINTGLQDIVESTLRERVEATQADWGCCILMETQTGKIRAISNLERDNDDGTYYEQNNRAVMRVEPGSTFKTIALMAALDDGKVELYDTVSVSSNGWRYFNANHTDSHKKDTVYTTRSALAISSNIALAKIITRGYEGSAKKFVKKVKKFGLTDTINWEIPGAHSTRIEVPKDTVTLSRMAYGYSVELSPMQILMFYNAIANDGKMIQPYLVSEIQKDGKTIKTFEAETINKSICSRSTLRDIRLCLHDVVWDDTLGTASVRWYGGKVIARKAQSDLVHIAGKTGTAQLLQEGHYCSTRHRMTFVGYFPEEAPRYTCICMIEYPKNYPAYDAGYDCGGVVRRIAEKTIAQTGIYVIRRDSLQLDIPNL